MLHVRCSKLPRFVTCPSSAVEPTTGKAADTDHELRRIGNAVHECLAKALLGEVVDVNHVCDTHQITDKDDVFMLMARGMKQYRTLQADVLGRKPEKVLTEVAGDDEIGGAIHLTGTSDLLMDSQIVHDWKSGYRIYEPRWQINGYTRLFGGAIGTVGWMRDDVVDVYTDLLKAHEFDDMLMDRFAQMGNEETFGEHCFGCERQHECETYRSHMRHTVLTFEATQGEIINVADLVAARPKAMLLEQYLKRYKAMCRAAVESSDTGTLGIGDGTELYIMSTEVDQINAAKAFKMATKYVTKEEYLGTLKVTKERLVGLVKDKAERGEKGKRAAQFIKDLEAEGAVGKRPMSQMRTRRVTK